MSGTWPVKLTILVLGGIYAGLFTPVKAGAKGSIGALLIGFARGSLTVPKLCRVLVDTRPVTTAVCFLIIAAQIYSRMLAPSAVPASRGDFAALADLGFWGLMLIYIVIMMGMILDSSSIMFILVPLEAGVASDPPIMLPEIEYLPHAATAEQMAGFFLGLTKHDLPDGEGSVVECLRIASHNGTHLDAS